MTMEYRDHGEFDNRTYGYWMNMLDPGGARLGWGHESGHDARAGGPDESRVLPERGAYPASRPDLD